MAATGDVSQMAGHSEKFGGDEPGSGENFFENLQRTALMRLNLANPMIAPQGHYLHRQGAYISHSTQAIAFSFGGALS